MSATVTGPGERLRLRRNPVRLLCSAAPWSAAGYLAGYLLVSWLLFSAAFTAGLTAALLAITLAGIPVLAAAAGVIRGCANVERGRLRLVFAEPVRARYRRIPRPGILAQVRTRWRDPATWRDTAYLLGLWLPLYALDLVVLTAWLALLAGAALPAWYWVPTGNAGLGYVSGTHHRGVALGYFPHGPHGHGAVGLYVDTLPKALLAAAACGLVLLVFNYVIVATGRAHARIARALLRPPADPLAVARDVLAGPGPLGPLTTRSSNGASSGRSPA